MTAVKTETLGPLREAGAAKKPRSLWSDAWRRLKRNRAAVAGAIYILVMFLVALFAPLLAPRNPNEFQMASSFSLPFWYPNADPAYPLGTDTLARDNLSRMIFGARVSMIVGFVPVIIITIIGTTYGLISGWLGGRADNIMMRTVDAVYAFPELLFLIIMQAAFTDTAFGNIGGGLVLMFVAFALTGWTTMSRLVRGQVLSIKEKEYVEAARSLGVSTPGILFRHILPNTLAPIIVAVTFAVPTYILYEASLSFIGIGVKPEVPTWGSMVNEAFVRVVDLPIFTLMPAALIALVMIAFTFLGDGLRDALDPQMGK